MRSITKNMKWRTVAVFAAALALVPALAAAQRGARAGRPGDDGEAKAPRQRVMERLDISEDQQRRLDDLREAGRREAILHRGRMAELRSRLEVAFLEDDVNDQEVKSLAAEISRLRSDMAERRIEHRLAVTDILTPDQREQIRKMARHAGPRARQFMQHRGGRGMGPGGPGMGGAGRGMRGACGMECPHHGSGAGMGRGGMMGEEFAPGAWEGPDLGMDFPGDDPGFGPWWMEEGGDDLPPPPPPAAPEDEGGDEYR